MEEILKLPEDMRERRKVLREELTKTVSAILNKELKEGFKKIFEFYGVTNATSVGWEFHPESDDEGGTDWHVSYFSVSTTDGRIDDLDEITIMRKSRYSDDMYELSLRDELHEFMYEYQSDAFEIGIEDVEL